MLPSKSLGNNTQMKRSLDPQSQTSSKVRKKQNKDILSNLIGPDNMPNRMSLGGKSESNQKMAAEQLMQLDIS